MNKSEFAKLYSRIRRAHIAAHAMSSAGFVRLDDLQDGSVTELEVVGIKSPEQLEDELLNLFIWIWSMKDYLKILCASRGVPPSRVEQIANSERSLTISADIANRAKHGVLSQSRSGDFAKLQNVAIAIPQSAIESIAFIKPLVRITADLPEDAELTAEIGFDTGIPSVDAFGTASQAISAWETLAFPLAGV